MAFVLDLDRSDLFSTMEHENLVSFVGGIKSQLVDE